MGNVSANNQGRNVAENNGTRLSRYTVLLGLMLGWSFPTSVAVYDLIKCSSDVVKLFVFGGLTLGVFAVASGLVAATLDTTEGTVRYVKFASLVGVTTALSLFTAALCMVFGAAGYKIACGCFFGLLIGVLDFVWIFSEW